MVAKLNEMKSAKIIALNFLFLGFMMSCGGPEETVEDGDPNELVKVEGGKFSGGVLRFNSIEDYTSLFPPQITDVYSTHIAGNVYEGLFRFDQKTLETIPALAESFEIDKTKKIYTFQIRKGIVFHDDECFEDGKGRELDANDIKYCLDFACSNHEYNKWNGLFSNVVVGVNKFQSGKAKGVDGIKVLGDYKIEITLEDPLSAFPDMLALLSTAIYPKEAIDKYGYKGMENHMVGTGPFYATKIENGSAVEFKKNKLYWRVDEFGNQLPFLNEVHVSFIKQKKDALAAFKNDELDMIWGLPVEEIENIMGTLEDAKEGKNKEFVVQTTNSLNIQYFGFKNDSEVFGDINVRKAFNYAVDRDSLVEYVLDGEGIPATNGFVPPMTDYPDKTVNGYNYNPKKAQELMAKAGFPKGKGFPETTLYLNASGGVNVKIAEFVVSMLQDNLGVVVKMETMPISDLYAKVEKGEVDFWRFGWIADYPDPATFLNLFSSAGNNEEQQQNYFSYVNPEFDAKLKAALKEIDPKKRNELYAQADQIVMDDAVIMPLMFTVGIRLLNPQLKDFDMNEMAFRDLARVYKIEKVESNVRVYDNLVDEEGNPITEE